MRLCTTPCVGMGEGLLRVPAFPSGISGDRLLERVLGIRPRQISFADRCTTCDLAYGVIYQHYNTLVTAVHGKSRCDVFEDDGMDRSPGSRRTDGNKNTGTGQWDTETSGTGSGWNEGTGTTGTGEVAGEEQQDVCVDPFASFYTLQTPGPSRRFHYRLRVALLVLYLVHTYRFISLCSLFPDCCCCSCSHRLADLYLTLWFGFADCRLSILLDSFICVVRLHPWASPRSTSVGHLFVYLHFYTFCPFFFFHVLYTYSSSFSPLGRTLFYLFSSVLAGAPSRAVENSPGSVVPGFTARLLVFFLIWLAFGWRISCFLVCLLLKNGIRVCKRLKEREEDLFPGFGCIGLGLV